VREGLLDQRVVIDDENRYRML